MHLSSLGIAIAALNVVSGLSERLPQITLGGDTASAAAPWPSLQLNYSSTAPYLFSSVSSLLQQWGNTFFPNGHSIVPCEIAPYTLFYHGRLDNDLPPSPEWLAFDIEMSYGIMGGTRNSHMLTYQTTKPVKVLYFDGESAALMGLGQLDTQMLHIYGNVSGPPRGGWGLADEYARASGLCDWLETAGLRGSGWGYEGVIRMNAGFELVWCNFTSPSLKLLTHLNVTAPQLPKKKEDTKERVVGRAVQEPETSYYPLPPTSIRTDHATAPTTPPLPPNWRFDPDREPFLRSQGWGWFSSATYHYGASRNGPGLGEVRASINSCGILSYYSPRFANLTRTRAETERELYNLTAQGYWKGEGFFGNRTIALTEIRRRRRYHHLEDATAEEALLMRNSSERALRSLLDDSNDCSGADWGYMANEITQNAGTHINQLAQMVGSFHDHSHNQSAIESWVSMVRAHSHLFYVGFLEYPPVYSAADWKIGSALYKVAYSRCRYRYTRLMTPSEGITLTPEESDLRWAIEETYGGICSILLGIGFQMEKNWAENFNQLATDRTRKPGSTRVLEKHYEGLALAWSDGLQQLMAWLGWEDVYTGCSEVCAWNERCYIPMWPLMARRGGGPGRRRPPGDRNGTYPYPPYGDGPPRGRPGGPGGSPDQKRPKGQSPWSMGDETELWAPRCAKVGHFMA